MVRYLSVVFRRLAATLGEHQLLRQIQGKRGFPPPRDRVVDPNWARASDALRRAQDRRDRGG